MLAVESSPFDSLDADEAFSSEGESSALSARGSV
jgi:hypothetical protein